MRPGGSTPLAYAGRRAALVTQHGKERALARPLGIGLGLRVEAMTDADTDTLGTFDGEVPRPGPSHEVVLAKAKLAIAAGHDLALASEGTFGPHPAFSFLARSVEHVAFVDAERGLTLVESLADTRTNFASLVLDPQADPARFLAEVGFPSHALVVRAAEWKRGQPLDKGVNDLAALRAAITRHARLDPNGRVRLDTDMRAHMNPTRMRAIRRLGVKLARRLSVPCPACSAPGFGLVDVTRGLACEACGTPTDLVVAEIWGCAACRHREERPRRDGRRAADEGSCPACNP